MNTGSLRARRHLSLLTLLAACALAIVAVSGVPSTACAQEASGELGAPAASDPSLVEPTAPAQERGHRLWYFFAGVPMGLVGPVLGAAAIDLLTDPCDGCLGHYYGIGLGIAGGVLTLAAAIILSVGGVEWADVDAHNRRIAEEGGAFLDASGLGVRF